MRRTLSDDPPTIPVRTRPVQRSFCASLEIRRGAARHRLRPIVGPMYLIGASTDCDLVLADPQFPEIHGYLLLTDEGLSLRHLGGGPEITVNGRAVEAVELLDGDRLRTGPYEFRVHLSPAPDGPERGTTAKEKPQPARSQRTTETTPVELVHALLADVRAVLAAAGFTAGCVAAFPPLAEREAA